MYGYLMRLGIALVVSSALFGVLERVWPAVRDDSRRHGEPHDGLHLLGVQSDRRAR